jgi:uncharacterized protein YbjT (DUF2867 family)
MRVVVTGATGNVGTSVVRALAADEPRRVGGRDRAPPAGIAGRAKVEWRQADVRRDELAPLFAGADAVVHLAWRIQPSHRQARAVADERARLSRVFAGRGRGRSARARARLVRRRSTRRARSTTAWTRAGRATACGSSFYGRHKAEAEWRLDAVEAANPGLRVGADPSRARVQARRPASGVRRLFAGPLLPTPLLPEPAARPTRRTRSPSAGRARRGCGARVRSSPLSATYGARFNVAAEPVLDASTVAAELGARTIRVLRLPHARSPR